MELYSLKRNNLNPIDIEPFKKEREIQNLIENNTDGIFELEFVSSEFKVGGFRIDTLCFDKENKSFIIIEYKKGKNYSLIDQGYTYLSLLLNHKSDFILEYNENKKNNLKREDIEWSTSKILFISPSFNAYQKNSVNFKDVPFELWEIKRFSNNTIVLNQHISNSSESIDLISGGNDNIIKNVNKEVKVYDEDYHISNLNEEMKENWNTIKTKLLDFDDVHFSFKKYYIGLVRSNNLVCAIKFRKKNLEFHIRRGNIKTDNSKSKNFFNLDDPKRLSKQNSWTYTDGTKGLSYTIPIKDLKELDYLLILIKQKYEVV